MTRTDDDQWLDIAFRVPRLEHCEEARLEALFPGRDGAWSGPSKAALLRHGTDRLDLNENWASVPPDWTCPGCSRSKVDLFRLSDNGVLLAHLDIHHDHLSDALKLRLRKDVASDWIHHISPMVKHIEEPIARLLARFAPVLICSDCNAADGNVKARKIRIHRSFSFSASEIAAFITPAPNMAHGINFDAALSIYESVKADFDHRLRLLDQFAGIIASGQLPQEPGNLPPPSSASPLDMPYYLHSSAIHGAWDNYQSISGDVDAFLRRSVSRQGTGSSGKKESQTAPDCPSHDDIRNHDGSGAPDLWRAVAEDWRCPACERTRLHILRRSKKGKSRWSGRLYRHTEFIFEEGYDEDDHEIERIDRHEIVLICGDCANIMPMLKQRNAELSRNDIQFQISDMRQIASASANAPHDIDWERATDHARASLGRKPAIDDYWSHHNRAISARSAYQDCLKKAGNPKRAWA